MRFNNSSAACYQLCVLLTNEKGSSHREEHIGYRDVTSDNYSWLLTARYTRGASTRNAGGEGESSWDTRELIKKLANTFCLDAPWQTIIDLRKQWLSVAACFFYLYTYINSQKTGRAIAISKFILPLRRRCHPLHQCGNSSTAIYTFGFCSSFTKATRYPFFPNFKQLSSA